LIVFISKNEADCRAFRQIAGQSPDSIVDVPDIEGAREQIRRTHPRVVVCDTDLSSSRNWRELLEEADAPEFALIVVSRCPTEALWAEVLNMGGFDVLALPFERDELQRVMSSALRSLRGAE
jgi:DNA-binding NtrC family response regulator